MPDLTSSPIAAYTLLPWVRRGFASRVTGSSTTNFASVQIALAVNGAPVPAPAVRLLGPGDIKSMDARAVIRTDPRDGVDDFEPNYLASIEFGQPDFPWMFTPTGPGADGRLRPWVCLVVVPDTTGATVTVRPNGAATLRLDTPLDPRIELPNLDEIDFWAHAQVMGKDLPDVPAALDGISGAHLSRIVCPRKLEPGKRYLACLVPTYRAAVNTGLGLPLVDTDLAPAWGPNINAPLTLPVYYSFRFQTGPGGDFASLAAKIRPVAPTEPALKGSRPMDVGDPRFGFKPSPTPGLTVGLEGALVPLLYQADPWPEPSKSAFRSSLRATLTPPPASNPLVTPPVYGRKQAAQELPADGKPPVWLADLNLDPRRRVAASAGAQVVQRDQEALVASAWEQVGEIRKANQLLRQAQLARQLSLSLAARHLDTVADDGAYLQMTAPVHARVQISQSPGGPAMTLRAQVVASRLPPGALSFAFRKLVRPRGPVGQRVLPAGKPSTMMSILNSASIPNLAPSVAFKPKGMVATQDAGFPVARALVARALPQPNFGTAVLTLGAQINLAPAPAPPPPPLGGAGLLGTPRAQLRIKLDPEQTIRARVGARVPLRTAGDPLRPLTSTVVFDEAMYAALADLGSEWMFPGISGLATNRAALLKTNPPFVEAFMVGLTDEMSRELLWREVPVDLDGTYFRNFWGTIKNGVVQPDIGDIALFNPASGLGSHTADPTGAKLVLLIRADLFRRYPNTLVSAVPAKWSGNVRTLSDTGRTYPIFRGQIGSDVYFFGFNPPDQTTALGTTVPTDNKPGWYFLLEEHPTEPRFGLEPTPSTSSSLPTWNDFAWTQVTTDHNHLRATTSPPPTPAGDNVAWGSGAAEMAYILMRSPVRIAMHARALIG